MMKRIVFLILIFLAGALPGYAAAPGQDLLLFYSNDVRGETEPCGCQADQLGGLSRKGFQFNKIASDTAKPHLTLDAGNLLFKDEIGGSAPAEQERMAAKAIVEAYGMMGYQAVAVGSRDLLAGPEFLRTLSKEAHFPWLSANLVDTVSRKPIFPASVTVKAGAVTALVIGLTGPTPLSAGTGATILPWAQVLPSLLTEAEKSADLVILLSNLPASDNQRIAETYSTVHLIIQSGSSASVIDPAPVNNTLTVNTASQGKQIGILTIKWQPAKRWGVAKTELLAKKRAALDSLQWQLSKYQGDQDPLVALQDQPERLKAYRLLLAREQELKTEIAEANAGSGGATGEPSTFSNRLLKVEDSLPGQKEIVALIDKLDRSINKLGQDKARPAEAKDSPYLGSQACGSCHAEQLRAWQQTKHAGAYTTLVNKKQQYNISCLPCHVTGVSMDQRHDALSVSEHRREVGCETCHGPGRKHKDAPQANPLTLRPAVSVCKGCHAPPHDTTFDYDARLKLVH